MIEMHGRATDVLRTDTLFSYILVTTKRLNGASTNNTKALT